MNLYLASQGLLWFAIAWGVGAMSFVVDDRRTRLTMRGVAGAALALALWPALLLIVPHAL